MAKRKTDKEYHNEVESVNPNIIIDGFYKNGLSKMKCTCKKMWIRMDINCKKFSKS
jgi:hypothetical protein